jgi:hypothetical protein
VQSGAVLQKHVRGFAVRQLFARTEMMNCNTSFHPRFLRGTLDVVEPVPCVRVSICDHLRVGGGPTRKEFTDVKAEGRTRGRRVSQRAVANRKPQGKLGQN